MVEGTSTFLQQATGRAPEHCTLVGKGVRHWYVVAGGVIDDVACFKPYGDNVELVVPNGMWLVVQVMKVGFAIRSSVFNGRLSFVFQKISPDGTLALPGDAGYGEGTSFCRLWSEVVNFKRAGLVLKDRKIQDAIRRQLSLAHLQGEDEVICRIRAYLASKAAIAPAPVDVPSLVDVLPVPNFVPPLAAVSPAPADGIFESRLFLSITDDFPVIDLSSLEKQFECVVTQFVPVQFEPGCIWKKSPVFREQLERLAMDKYSGIDVFAIRFNLGMLYLSDHRLIDAKRQFYIAYHISTYHSNPNCWKWIRLHRAMIRRWLAKACILIGGRENIDEAKGLLESVYLFFDEPDMAIRYPKEVHISRLEFNVINKFF